MKGFICIHIICCLFIMASAGSADPPYGPWNSDVAVGDEAVSQEQMNKIKDNLSLKINNPEDSHIHHQSLSVYNGFQGGAYFLIRFFQVFISPQDGPNCRYRPVCSAYGKHAVIKHGALLGAMLAGDRIIRCNPFNPPGDDPVPHRIFSSNENE